MGGTMRKLFVSLLFVGGLVGLAAPAGAAPSESACNQGTMNAHGRVPHDNPALGMNPAHMHIPHCM